MAQNDEGVVGEDDTLTVANSANASVTGSYDLQENILEMLLIPVQVLIPIVMQMIALLYLYQQ